MIDSLPKKSPLEWEDKVDPPVGDSDDAGMFFPENWGGMNMTVVSKPVGVRGAQRVY